jgi:hypothetical protein
MSGIETIMTPSIRVAVPDRPFRKDLVSQLRALVRRQPQVIEAHLLLCHIPEVTEDVQPVVFVILENDEEGADLVDALSAAVQPLLLKDESMYFLPLAVDEPGLGDIRQMQCSLLQTN